MDYNKLADLIFADITDTVDDLEKRFPERDLPEGARVTRFAPSPTGYMHIGGLYAAMISRKLAKQSGGVFYLRIEDTDRKRELEDGVNEIINSLKKFDLGFDHLRAARPYMVHISRAREKRYIRPVSRNLCRKDMHILTLQQQRSLMRSGQSRRLQKLT